MKKATILSGFIVLLAIFFSETANILAQEEDKINVTDLKVPISPVINLLGVSPTEVVQPTAPKAFGFTALESATNSQGDFLNNFAIEIAPYWWFPHPNLSFDEYYKKTGFGEALLQHFSFSIGTTSTSVMDNDDEVEGSRVGVGVRTSLLAGNKTPLMNNKLQEYLDIARVCGRELNSQSQTSNQTDIEGGVKILENCSVQDKKVEIIEELNALGTDRVGWQLDVANAYTFDSPNDDIENLDLSRIGAWLTASYRSVGIDKVVKKVGEEACNAEIESILKYKTGDNYNFSNQDINAAIQNYDCIRRPNASNIIFFDNKIGNINVGNCKIKDFQEDNHRRAKAGNDTVKPKDFEDSYVCVSQSGLSVLKIIDKVNNTFEQDEDQNQINNNCQKNVISLVQKQKNFRLRFRDIDRTESLVSNFSNEQSKQYKCATLTLPATSIVASEPIIKSIVIDTLKAPAKNQRCYVLLDNFLLENSLQDESKYTCAEFSWPSFTIAIDYMAAKDIDEKCAVEIEEEQKSTLKFLQYQCSYKPNQFSFLGIGRYIRDEFSGEEEDNFDGGASVVWHPSIDSKLQLSAEYLRRFGGEEDDRFVGGVRYRFNDTYELFSSVGKAFDDGFDGDNLVTIFGINVGLGKNALSAPKP